jgi:hypothetical protein
VTTLAQKLIGYLNRVFDKGPDQYLVLRMRYDGGMVWSVRDGVLRTVVTGGSGQALNVDLSAYTVATLAAYIQAQPGYSVPFVDATPVPGLDATVLIDGGSNQNDTNGDLLNAYTSVLWAYMTAQAGELRLLRAAIAEALAQMAANTASGEWVDEHGSYYAVPRQPGESDAAYASRIVAEVGQARGTRTALSVSVRRATGAESVEVMDYDTPIVGSGGVSSYGLFDVDVVLDANTPLSSIEIERSTLAVIEAVRDAGTHLRKLRYIRSSTLRLFASGYLSFGYDVMVSFSALTLDGSWLLDGSEDLDGIRGLGAARPIADDLM